MLDPFHIAPAPDGRGFFRLDLLTAHREYIRLFLEVHRGHPYESVSCSKDQESRTEDEPAAISSGESALTFVRKSKVKTDQLEDALSLLVGYTRENLHQGSMNA